MKIAKPLFSILFLIVGFAISSCGGNSGRTNPKDVVVDDDPVEIIIPDDPDPVPDVPQTVDVAVYREYPEEIDGCACYFGKSALELNVGDYIFMTNYEKKAYMKLDGTMRVFTLVSSTDSESGSLINKWSNENYQMVVETTETGQVDETWQSVGTIKITPKDDMPTTISVVGECGC